MTEDLNDMLRKLEIVNQAASDLSKGQSLILSNALTPEFIASRTKFKTAEEFFAAAGVDYKSPDFDGTSDDFVQGNSQFSTWQEFLNAATQHWLLGDTDNTAKQ